jgi:DNA repair protein RadC
MSEKSALSEKNLHEGHRKRLRKRFIDNGTKGFQSHEILELLLFYVLSRKNTNDISHKIMNKFGSISAVLDADMDKLSSIEGISTESAVFLRLIRDICRSYAISSRCSKKLETKDDIEDYMMNYFHKTDSTFIMINIDMNMELVETIAIAPEVLNPRSITATTIINKFYRIIVGVYHQDQIAVPNDSDYSVLTMISSILKSIHTNFYDFVICGINGAFSTRSHSAFNLDYEGIFE